MTLPDEFVDFVYDGMSLDGEPSKEEAEQEAQRLRRQLARGTIDEADLSSMYGISPEGYEWDFDFQEDPLEEDSREPTWPQEATTENTYEGRNTESYNSTGERLDQAERQRLNR